MYMLLVSGRDAHRSTPSTLQVVQDLTISPEFPIIVTIQSRISYYLSMFVDTGERPSNWSRYHDASTLLIFLGPESAPAEL